MAGRVSRRRVELPAADDLFRATERPRSNRSAATPVVRAVPSDPDGEADEQQPATRPRRSSGRVRHDEKMTVYITSGELLELEHARLALRAEHGLAVDRGRLVREAVSLVLADLEANGAESALVRRLVQE